MLEGVLLRVLGRLTDEGKGRAFHLVRGEPTEKEGQYDWPSKSLARSRREASCVTLFGSE